ncbi:hypothetical protein ACIQ9E_10770 [Streptomyces sp. NPDC094448]|uniref:hypothetical protein n=1 Tax=Streptomyces sp. NPDC094448 TaxID=3366063 RepID=UPI0037FACF51
MAALAVLGVFAAGCSAGGTGLRDSGPAPGDAAKNPGGPASSPPGPAAPGTGAKSPDAVALLRKDPKVDPSIKASLKPCVEDQYPVDVALGHLTGGSVPDVVVNVTSCGDGVAIGSFVYRSNGTGYVQVFGTSEFAVYSSIDRDELVVTKQVYGKSDPVATPTAEEVTTYRWSGGASGQFARAHWTRTEYGGLPSADGGVFEPGSQPVPPGRTVVQGGRSGPVTAPPADPAPLFSNHAAVPPAMAAQAPAAGREKS